MKYQDGVYLFTITGLSTMRRYRFRLRLEFVDGSNEYVWVSPDTFQTLGEIPQRPTCMNRSRFIEINWGPPEPNQYAVQYYIVQSARIDDGSAKFLSKSHNANIGLQSMQPTTPIIDETRKYFWTEEEQTKGTLRLHYKNICNPY